MPAALAMDAASKKRKRPHAAAAPAASSKSSRSKPTKKVKAVQQPPPDSDAEMEGQDDEDEEEQDEAEEDVQSQILSLEAQILESKKHYNNIATLLSLCQNPSADHAANITAAVALCRVFCRLMAAERMVKAKAMSDAELQAVDWLKTRLREYVQTLAALLPDEDLQSTALTLLMRLVKEETQQDGRRAEQAWRTGVFAHVVRGLVEVDSDALETCRDEFVEKYVEEHDDVRFFTFYQIANILGNTHNGHRPTLVANSLSLLSSIEGIPDSESQLEDWYGTAPPQDGKKHMLLKLLEHRKTAQEAWLCILRSPLDKDARKRILSILTTRIVPWFTKIELLMDFLTDSYNAGGASSLLALAGLFHLMSEKNLDYPAFYTKLYSLLDDSLLHSKHRSRFFRLLNTFMSSTHLPAALVASFIKRLSRLALHAPPAAIVVIVPWTYNMFKRHPTCTFMLHRVPRLHYSAATIAEIQEQGMDDPFDMAQSDPMETGAIESSLWEIETLSSHYHPNVATLAGIIAQQFTKQRYELEDFLDHTYNGLVEGELERVLKKAPVVEFEIPKRIITAEDGALDRVGGLLETAILATA